MTTPPKKKKRLNTIGLIMGVFVIQLSLCSSTVFLARESIFKVASVMAYSKWRPFAELRDDFILGLVFAFLATLCVVVIRFTNHWLIKEKILQKARWISTTALLLVLGGASLLVYTNFQEYSEPGNYFDWDFAGERVKGQFPFWPRDVRQMTCRVEDPQNPCTPGECKVDQLLETLCVNESLDLAFRWENRFGYVMKAHVNPDGTRRCAEKEADNKGDNPVVFIGDSFAYGVGLKDEGTLCWKVREKVQQTRPHDFQFINMGQPGANIFSYGKNARYAIEAFEPAIVFVEVLITDDAQPFDVNLHYEAARWLPFQIAASILEPQIVLDATTILFDFSFSETVVSHVIRKGIDDLVTLAEEKEVPIVFYVYAGEEGGISDYFKFYAHLINEAANQSKWIHSLGGLSVVSPLGETYIPGDGHPTALGNELLAPFFQDALSHVFPRRVGGAP